MNNDGDNEVKMANEKRALSGIKVCDLTQGIAGPHATMLLALHGADVTKIEPLDGDWSRVLGKPRGQETTESIAVNRAKRSVSCDLKSEAGREIVRRMIAQSDIFIESFRPGVIARMGLGYEEVRKIKPDIVYASISGFGQTGPNAQRPTVDGLIQAYSGMMVMNRTPDGIPHRQGMIAVDVLTGLYIYQAVSAALIRQLRFGEGSFLDISMMQSAAAFQSAKIMEHVAFEGKPAPLYVPSGMYPTADGYVVISGMRDRHFAALCEVMNRSDLATDPRWPTQTARVQHGEFINGEIRKETVKRTTAEWLKDLHAAGVFAEVVQGYSEWLDSEHVKAVQAYTVAGQSAFGPLPMVHIPGTSRDDSASDHRTPLIGEHTRELLGELGFEAAWINEQIAAGKIGETVRPATTTA